MFQGTALRSIRADPMAIWPPCSPYFIREGAGLHASGGTLGVVQRTLAPPATAHQDRSLPSVIRLVGYRSQVNSRSFLRRRPNGVSPCGV